MAQKLQRWGVPQRNRCTEVWEAERQNPGSGYLYGKADLTNNYLQNLWATDPVFNRTLHRTFNSNYQNFAIRYRENIERGGIRREAYVRFNDESKFLCLLFHLSMTDAFSYYFCCFYIS